MKVFTLQWKWLLMLPLHFSFSLCLAQAGHGIDAKCPCDYPPMQFKKDSVKLSADHKMMLESIANNLRHNPLGILVITMHTDISKHGQTRCGERIAAIKKYMMEREGISGDRVVGVCDASTGAYNTADMECSIRGD